MPCSRRRNLNRRLNRPLTRRCSRRLVRRIGRGPRVDQLRQALAAFGRAVRARRRLVKLAPECFDAALTPRLADEPRLAERRHRELDAALLNVYGQSEPHRCETNDRCGNGAETVRFSRRRFHQIEVALVEYEAWMEAGRQSFARYRWWQPYRRVGLRTISRLIDVATQFGRLACGTDVNPVTNRLLKDKADFDLHAISVEDALERVYGTRGDELGEIV